MEKEKIDQFLMINGKNFPEESMAQLRKRLANINESKANMLISMEWKSPMVGFLFAFFLGTYGIDRFWLKETGLGIFKLITIGGCGIWWLIDLFTISKRTKAFNLNKLDSIL
ncbi:TM2 domain-containing protein [Bacteroides heparinolyticus]|uniref:TM2 domain-containing protein n=1 Tax=Prevotella heparinolytica TaxID=28113 RepID=UPI0023F165BD|nr:TM2 domain-containing protein [Bacteroides heparinolyticus]